MEMQTQNEKEFAGAAFLFAKGLNAHSDKAYILALSGDLGSGKTTFTKYLAEALGATASVQSPTFILERSYAVSEGGFKNLVHIDGYRFDIPEEGKILALKDRITNSKLLFVIEWPEKFGTLLPKPDTTISFSHEGGEARRITIV